MSTYSLVASRLPTERNGVEGALSEARAARACCLTSNINGEGQNTKKSSDIHVFKFNSRARAFVAFCRLSLRSGSVALTARYNYRAGEAHFWPIIFRGAGGDLSEVHIKRLGLDRSTARVGGVRDSSCRLRKNLDLRRRDLLT
jgi:hypothetical protein